MKTLDFSGTPREVIGKAESKRLRQNKQVPAILYGSKENVNFSVDLVEFEKIISSPDLYLINLKVGEKTTRAIIQDVQYDPITDKPIHVDFLEALAGKKANLSIPVKIFGDSVGVLAGGTLVVKMRKLRVRGIPADMPETIDVDISDLDIGKSIKVNELGDFNFLDPGNSVVVRVKAERSAEALEPVLDEDLEGEEGEATEGGEEGAKAEGGEATKEGGEEAKKEEAPAES